jgi:tyrosyl-tRNA synthetase
MGSFVLSDCVLDLIDPDKYNEKLAKLQGKLQARSTLFADPHYLGHMNFDVSLAHFDAFVAGLKYNQNNVATESSPYTVKLEAKFIQAWIQLVGYPSSAAGYISVGGTLSNLEALRIARDKKKALGGSAKYVLASDQAHYSVKKSCDILGLELVTFENVSSVPIAEICCCVVTIGRTETGLCEDLPTWLAWCHEHNVWCHADAAYGGYFLYVKDSPLLSVETRASLTSLCQADSIAFDPHKHGYAPYPCGGFLIKKADDFAFTRSTKPTYVGLDVSAYTVEGSRAGAMAVSAWFGQKILGPIYPTLMQNILNGVVAYKAALLASRNFEPIGETDLGIVLFAIKEEQPPFSYFAEKFTGFTNVQAGKLQLVAAEYEGRAVFRAVVMRPDFEARASEFVAQLDSDYEEYAAGYEGFIQQRLQTILGIVEEVETVPELEALLRTGRTLVAYNGFEPSGRIHIAQAVVTVLNANALTKNGFRFIIYIADWFAQLNHKMGGDLDKIKTVGRYFVEVFKACGLNPDKTEIVWASDLITGSPTYWPRVLDVATRSTLNRVNRCCQIMGRKESDTLSASQIIYPCMQCADIFELGVDCPQLGIDQRKVNMLAREYAAEIKVPPPVVLSHHMLPGLKGPAAGKMSKSIPDSAIFMEDPASEVERKMLAAYCNDVIVDNPIFEYYKYILFRWFKSITIDGVEFTSIEEFAAAFPKLNKKNVKIVAAELVNQILEPVRQRFATGPLKELSDEVASFRVTR